MTATFAFIVGIEQYDYAPGWNVEGPGDGAVSIARWLLNFGVPGDHIALFVSASQRLASALQSLEKAGVNVQRQTSHEVLSKFARASLTAPHPVDSRLFVYWSGHGYARNDGARVFLCSDYTEQLSNRVFNGSCFVRWLRSREYASFRQQIILADVCAVHTELQLDDDMRPPERMTEDTEQTVYFATAEGVYARGNDAGGQFTATALQILSGLSEWPTRDALTLAMRTRFAGARDKPFRVLFGYDGEGVLEPPIAVRSNHERLFQSVYSELSTFRIDDETVRRHYLRTVSSLGEPALGEAMDLEAMVRELCALRDAGAPGKPPYGLVEFVIRLGTLPILADWARTWLAREAHRAGNAIANVEAALAAEAERKIVIVDVESDERGELLGYELSVRDRMLNPIATYAVMTQTRVSWRSFCERLVADLLELRDRGVVDAELQFVVDAPVFDRAFHGIELADGQTLGQGYIVVLRHRERLRRPSSIHRASWTRYAESLRKRNPKDEVLPVEVRSNPAGKVVLPEELGLYYASFVMSDSDPTRRSMREKRILLDLLRRGIPYLYWMHERKDGEVCWKKLVSCFQACLGRLDTLDDFPRELTFARVNNDESASSGSLLWDDPAFDPFDKIKRLGRA